MKKEDKKKLMLGTGVILILVLFGTGAKMISEEVETVKGNWDISEEVRAAGLEQYLVEEEDFDYSNPQLQAIAEDIKATTPSSFEAVKRSMRYVYNNIRYDSRVTVASCYEETASSTLEVGSSDCVGMVRVNMALLRAMGIPARTMGGCLTSKRGCTATFAVTPGEEFKVVPPVEGDFKKRGFLHEWIEVWTPEKGWQILEATSGKLFDMECDTFLEYGYDSNKFNRCVINDRAFWEKCKAA